MSAILQLLKSVIRSGKTSISRALYLLRAGVKLKVFFYLLKLRSYALEEGLLIAILAILRVPALQFIVFKIHSEGALFM